MNFRLTAILFASILVIGVALLIYTFTGDDSPPADVLMEELVALKPEDISSVEMAKEDGSRLKLVRAGKDQWNAEWDVPAPDGKGKVPVQAKADAAAVTQLIAGLLKAKPVAHPNLVPNLAVLGLQPPGLRVTLRQGDERSSTINFGDVTIGGPDAAVFVTTSRRSDRPMATSRGGIEGLFRSTGGSGKTVDLAKWASDFRVKSVFGVDPRAGGDDVSAVNLSAKGKTLALDHVNGAWTFKTPAGWGAADVSGDPSAAPGSFTGARSLIGTLTNLQASAPADFIESPTPQQLKDYGLEAGDPNAIRVEITNKAGEKTVAFIGKKDTAPVPGAPGMPAVQSGKVWVRIEGQPGVVRATGGDLAGLAAIIENPDPLRDRTLLALERARIDGIDLSGGVHLRRTGLPPEWKLYGPPTPAEPQSTSPQAVDRLLDVLTERRTIRSFPAANDANFAPGQVQTEVKVWADAFEPVDPKNPKAEPKPKGKVQPFTLIFGKREGDAVHVRRVMPDGGKSDFLLPDRIKVGTAAEPVELLAAIRKSRLDLLDAALKTFSPEMVKRLAVGGMANYVLDRDEKKDPSTGSERWTFASPADRKGQTADAGTVGEMLRILGTTQSVTRFVNEAPDEAALIEYGFLSPKMPATPPVPAPRLKVTVGLKDAPAAESERTYEFGKETSDPAYVYARQVGRLAVFTVPRLVFDRLATPDLRDRAIFRFDPAQVTAIDFKGWGKAGFVTELKVEKNKDGVWVATKPDKYALDPAKVTAFLTLLNRTSVKAFVPGTPTPEQGFGNPKEELIITLKMASGPGIALNLTGLTPDGLSYYGWTSILPQSSPVYTVDAAPFRPYKESSGAFAR